MLTNWCAGLFFFTLALFGFSCLSSLTLFANERILFMRERYVWLSIAYWIFSADLCVVQCERILLSLHLLLIKGTFYSAFASLYFKCSDLLADPVRHLAFTSSAAPCVWRDRVRLRAHGSCVLEVHSHARALQSHDGERHPHALDCLRERQRGQFGWDADYVVQVSEIRFRACKRDANCLRSLLFAGLLINRQRDNVA